MSHIQLCRKTCVYMCIIRQVVSSDCSETQSKETQLQLRSNRAARLQQHPPNWPRLVLWCREMLCSQISFDRKELCNCGLISCILSCWCQRLVKCWNSGFLLMSSVSFFLRHNCVSRHHHSERDRACCYPHCRGTAVKRNTHEDTFRF